MNIALDNSVSILTLEKVKAYLYQCPEEYEWFNPVRDNVGLIIRLMFDLTEDELRELLFDASDDSNYLILFSWRMILEKYESECEEKNNNLWNIIDYLIDNGFSIGELKNIEYFGEKELDFVAGDFSVNRFIDYLNKLISTYE